MPRTVMIVGDEERCQALLKTHSVRYMISRTAMGMSRRSANPNTVSRPCLETIQRRLSEIKNPNKPQGHIFSMFSFALDTF